MRLVIHQARIYGISGSVSILTSHRTSCVLTEVAYVRRMHSCGPNSISCSRKLVKLGHLASTTTGVPSCRHPATSCQYSQAFDHPRRSSQQSETFLRSLEIGMLGFELTVAMHRLLLVAVMTCSLSVLHGHACQLNFSCSWALSKVANLDSS